MSVPTRNSERGTTRTSSTTTTTSPTAGVSPTNPVTTTTPTVTEAQAFDNLTDQYTMDPVPTGEPTTVETTGVNVTNDQFVDDSSGQLQGDTPQVTQTVAETSTARTPEEIQASLIEAVKAGEGIEDLLNEYQFATASLNDDSTVRGQLTKLMSDFEDGKAPAWAAGAIRNANAAMAARGIAASSMAGQAILQATMESALPIAQQDAQTNFQLQMQNLSNEQQMLMQKNQSRTEGFFTDIATENATRQFNASSENQIKQFNTNLRAQVDQFNAAQMNAMEEFNAGQGNAMSMFTAQMEDMRQQFNAQNRLIIDQANAKWRQQIATQDNANTNEANRLDAQLASQMSLSEMNNLFQARRDAINFAFNSTESAKDRATQLLIASMTKDEMAKARKADSSNALWGAVGSFAASWFD